MKKIGKWKWQLVSVLLGIVLVSFIVSCALPKTNEVGVSEEDPFAKYTHFYDHWWDTSGLEWDSGFRFTKDTISTYYVNDSEIEHRHRAKYTRVGDAISIKDKDVIDFFGFDSDTDEIRIRVLSQSISQLIYTVTAYDDTKEEAVYSERLTASFREDREFYQIMSGEVEREDAVTKLEQQKWYQINNSLYIFKITEVSVDYWHKKKVYRIVFYRKNLTDLAVISWIGLFQARDEKGDASKLEFGTYRKAYEVNLLPLREESIILQDEYGDDHSIVPILEKLDGRWRVTGDSVGPKEVNGEIIIHYIGELATDNKEHQEWIKQAEELEQESQILEDY